MGSHDDDNLDFTKIQRELDAAVEADQKYYRENDAKFRAVHQKVATYDEFRDIVLASHIKPLEKGDRISDCKVMNQPWNQVANTTNNTTKTQTSQIQESKRIPKSGQEFAQYWRRHCKTMEDKYTYLLEIGSERLLKIFQTEISFGLLGDILQALSTYNTEDKTKVADILNCLSQCNRFSLSVQFLSSKEKQTCQQLLVNLKKDLVDQTEMIEILNKLEKLYE